MQISINGIKKNFGDKTAVSIDKFNVENGEIVGLVGNNGAGKTTLFRLMLDLIKADEGQILLTPMMKDTVGTAELSSVTTTKQSVGAINPAKSEEWKRLTGAYIDDGFLIDFLTPEEYFYFIGKVNGLLQEETEMRLAGFSSFLNGEILGQKKLIRNLSAGNKQKVGIISAMLNRPQLLILDEPFNFLDPTSQNVLKHLLTAYNRETGATILISSHNLSHTVDISTRIALLEAGSIIKNLPNANGGASKELAAYFNVE